MFTHHGDAEATQAARLAGLRAWIVFNRSLGGGAGWRLRQTIDYAFTADQFRTTGEFPNDAYRITSGTANLGFASPT